MSQFDIKLDYLSSHMVSQELYHLQFIIYFISSAQCEDFIFHSALTLVIPHVSIKGYYKAPWELKSIWATQITECLEAGL